MSDTLHTVALIAVMALVTMVLRFLPFWLFPAGKKTPAFILYLGRVLPCAVMGMLAVYCYKNIKPLAWPHGLPELIAGAIVVGLHLWKRNTLLSIVTGTVSYMLLLQFVF